MNCVPLNKSKWNINFPWCDSVSYDAEVCWCVFCVPWREFAKKSGSRGSSHQLVNDVFHLLTSDVAVIHFHYTARSIGTHQADCKTGDREQRKLRNAYTHMPVGQVEGILQPVMELLFSLVLLWDFGTDNIMNVLVWKTKHFQFLHKQHFGAPRGKHLNPTSLQRSCSEASSRLWLHSVNVCRNLKQTVEKAAPKPFFWDILLVGISMKV